MDRTKRTIEIPSVLPVLPVRNTVLFPNAAVPLFVGRPSSVAAIQHAQRHGDLLLVVSQKDGAMDNPTQDDLYRIGVICLVAKVTELERNSFQLIANGLCRFRIDEFVSMGDFMGACGTRLEDRSPPDSPRIEMLAVELKKLGQTILQLASIAGAESLSKLFGQLDDPSHIGDLAATFLSLSMVQKQQLLEELNVEVRLTRLFDLMIAEKDKLTLQNEIQSKMSERLSKDHRDQLLREQLKTIHDELGGENNIQEQYSRKIRDAGLSEEAGKAAREELNRLVTVPRTSPEYHVIRTYLDWLTALPWQRLAGRPGNAIHLNEARAILDEHHHALESVKRRIVQFLAVTKLKPDHKGPILCLLGPPGVGKTSLGRAIARCLGRPFVRASLGGVRDEAEIRGHRRTYVGALPGRVLQQMKRAGSRDPVFMLDEIDKIGTDFRGDPASALLEVLDPEQNGSFLDHYLDVPFDLSRVFFLTTANVVETIPPALRDRLEIIEMTSYSAREKLAIAQAHLVPRYVEEHGIPSSRFELPRETLEFLLEAYTREAGVRGLGRHIATICRAAAEALAGEMPPDRYVVDPKRAEEILGPRRYFPEPLASRRRPGMVTGLAWTPAGGEILTIEASRMPGRGRLLLTGQLGDVMKESAKLALSLTRADALAGSLPFAFEKTDFHLHVPSGAVPKDGPSAGLALYLALCSLLAGEPVDASTAFTGEITLRGSVLPVGGIKEKVLAAHRAGVKRVVLPRENEGALREVPEDVRADLQFVLVGEAEEGLMAAGLQPTARATFLLPPDIERGLLPTHPPS